MWMVNFILWTFYNLLIIGYYPEQIFISAVIQESGKNKRAKRYAEDDSATSPTKKAHSEIDLEFEKTDVVPDGKSAFLLLLFI